MEKHLLVTPPSSPGALDESPLVSPAQADLGALQWKTLVETNKKLHDRLGDLVSPLPFLFSERYGDGDIADKGL